MKTTNTDFEKELQNILDGGEYIENYLDKADFFRKHADSFFKRFLELKETLEPSELGTLALSCLDLYDSAFDINECYNKAVIFKNEKKIQESPALDFIEDMFFGLETVRAGKIKGCPC